MAGSWFPSSIPIPVMANPGGSWRPSSDPRPLHECLSLLRKRGQEAIYEFGSVAFSRAMEALPRGDLRRIAVAWAEKTSRRRSGNSPHGPAGNFYRRFRRGGRPSNEGSPIRKSFPDTVSRRYRRPGRSSTGSCTMRRRSKSGEKWAKHSSESGNPAVERMEASCCVPIQRQYRRRMSPPLLSFDVGELRPVESPPLPMQPRRHTFSR